MTGKDLWDLGVYALKYAGPLGLVCAVGGALLMYPTDCSAPVLETAKCETGTGEVPVGESKFGKCFLTGCRCNRGIRCRVRRRRLRDVFPSKHPRIA
jgi:hypothetical protein